MPYSTTFVIVFWISDPGVRSLWSLCLGFWVTICDRWACVRGGYRIYFRAITAFDRGGRSRRILLRTSYLGVNFNYT